MEPWTLVPCVRPLGQRGLVLISTTIGNIVEKDQSFDKAKIHGVKHPSPK